MFDTNSAWNQKITFRNESKLKNRARAVGLKEKQELEVVKGHNNVRFSDSGAKEASAIEQTERDENMLETCISRLWETGTASGRMLIRNYAKATDRAINHT